MQWLIVSIGHGKREKVEDDCDGLYSRNKQQTAREKERGKRGKLKFQKNGLPNNSAKGPI